MFNQLNKSMKQSYSYGAALKECGFSYLGSTSSSMKVRLSEENGVLTYIVYLAPADMSGYNVCPVSKWCKRFCLNGSGRNKIEKMSGHNRIESARIKKARLFFENLELFMFLLVREIDRWRRYAEKHNLAFAVRLNGTSDISPEDFVLDGKNILEIFPDVQFYDYTKMYSRISLLKKYKNYDLTYSWNGHNQGCVDRFLKNGGKVAVVFSNRHKLPLKFMGYDVIDGNIHDIRFIDPSGVIIGLHYHTTAANYDKQGNYIEPNADFVVRDNSPLCQWAS